MKMNVTLKKKILFSQNDNCQKTTTTTINKHTHVHIQKTFSYWINMNMSEAMRLFLSYVFFCGTVNHTEIFFFTQNPPTILKCKWQRNDVFWFLPILFGFFNWFWRFIRIIICESDCCFFLHCCNCFIKTYFYNLTSSGSLQKKNLFSLVSK